MFQQNQEFNETRISQKNGVTLNPHSMFQLSRHDVYELAIYRRFNAENWKKGILSKCCLSRIQVT